MRQRLFLMSYVPRYDKHSAMNDERLDKIFVRIRRTWPQFFARHGNLTPIQRAAIPKILRGANTLIISATASGKTEAAIVPLIERHLLKKQTPSQRKSLCLLIICPTRALTRDLYERLLTPLTELGVVLAMKTGDTAGISFKSPPAVLITTPESTDSLLTRAPRIFTQLQAIVLDEIHLFDNSPRGDHLLCLLQRIEHIRAYFRQSLSPDDAVLMRPLQRVALSATVPDPEGLAQRYLINWAENVSAELYEIVAVHGQRGVNAVVEPMGDLGDVARQMNQRAAGAETIRKSLLFCNTRNEVEQTATFLRKRLAYDAAVFVHYSNLDALVRRQTEIDFSQAAVAVCVATSTLELGIDIGSIDDVVLLGPPPSLTSFLQRIGRGGRRTGQTHVLCMARSAQEQIRFEALIAHANVGQMAQTESTYRFRPSVLVQQVFSGLKQSPTGAIRLADLRRVVPGFVFESEDKVETEGVAEIQESGGIEGVAKELTRDIKQAARGESSIALNDDDLRDIIRNLVRQSYLKAGRIGEWRPGPMLDELLDAHEIYSNIGSDLRLIAVIDTFSGRTIAQSDRRREVGETFLLGGRMLEVLWQDWSRMGVRPLAGAEPTEQMRFATAPFTLSFEDSQSVAAYFGVAPNQLVLMVEEGSTRLFHFWGGVYGTLLATTLRAQLYPESVHLRGDHSVDNDGESESDEDGDEVVEPLSVESGNEFCVRLPEPLLHLPALNRPLATRSAQELLPRLQPFLSLGRFHSLLPPGLGHAVAMDHLNLPRFGRLYDSASIRVADAELRERLAQLL